MKTILRELAMTKIDAKYLTKVYKNGEYALKNCSLSIKDGEFLVILGSSGAGKSTLLKVLAGTEALSCGELYFDGILAENLPVSKRNASMVFQEYVLYPHMTVFDNLATPLKVAGEDARSIYDRVMQALRVFDLEMVADVKPKNLSGGEQQRVALAKALLRQSSLVLLDEPLSSVDEEARREYCSLLKMMKRLLPKSTFVYVTHNVREALYLADRIAVMDDGAILQVAPADLILKQPEHRLVLEIMGQAESVSEYLFDTKGRSLETPSTELKLDGRLNGKTLAFANKSIELDDEYLSRLLRRSDEVRAGLTIEKFSKTMMSNGFSLVFEVVENAGNYLVLSACDERFILHRKTALNKGEKIRMYYKIEDIALYDGSDRLTCHYPLNRQLEINVIDADKGRFEILGKRVQIQKPIPRGSRFVYITEESFELSHGKGECTLCVDGCLDEEFINGKKLNHIAIKGLDGYLSVMSEDNVSCFGKEKVYLNMYTDKLKFMKGIDAYEDFM